MNTDNHAATIARITEIVCENLPKHWEGRAMGRLWAEVYAVAEFHYDGSTYSYYIARDEARKALTAAVGTGVQA